MLFARRAWLTELLRRSAAWFASPSFCGALDGFGDARLVERLQDVIYGVLPRTLVRRTDRTAVEIRRAAFFHFLDELLSTPKTVQPAFARRERPNPANAPD